MEHERHPLFLPRHSIRLLITGELNIDKISASGWASALRVGIPVTRSHLVDESRFVALLSRREWRVVTCSDKLKEVARTTRSADAQPLAGFISDRAEYKTWVVIQAGTHAAEELMAEK